MLIVQFTGLPAVNEQGGVNFKGEAGGFTFNFRVSLEALQDANAGQHLQPALTLFGNQQPLFHAIAQARINQIAAGVVPVDIFTQHLALG